MHIPNTMPVLSAGGHRPEEGKACVMEYVSLLAGEKWSDRPSCTHPALAHVARYVNDNITDRKRHLLVPLIGRLFGTTDASPRVNNSLTYWAINQTIVPTGPVMEALDLIRHQIDADVDADMVRTAIVSVSGTAAASTYCLIYRGLGDPSSLTRAETVVTYAMEDQFEGTISVPVGLRSVETQERMVSFLSRLIDEYDRVTGRTVREIGDADLCSLAEAVVGR